jgi:hypothetical protein
MVLTRDTNWIDIYPFLPLEAIHLCWPQMPIAGYTETNCILPCTDGNETKEKARNDQSLSNPSRSFSPFRSLEIFGLPFVSWIVRYSWYRSAIVALLNNSETRTAHSLEWSVTAGWINVNPVRSEIKWSRSSTSTHCEGIDLVTCSSIRSLRLIARSPLALRSHWRMVTSAVQSQN